MNLTDADSMSGQLVVDLWLGIAHNSAQQHFLPKQPAEGSCPYFILPPASQACIKLQLRHPSKHCRLPHQVQSGSSSSSSTLLLLSIKIILLTWRDTGTRFFGCSCMQLLSVFLSGRAASPAECGLIMSCIVQHWNPLQLTALLRWHHC